MICTNQPLFASLKAEIEETARVRLDNLSMRVWTAHAAGRLDDATAQHLAELIAARRETGPLYETREATPMEMAAQFARLDRDKIHRRSVDIDAPECRIDGNQAAKILVRAYAVERETYKRRARGAHRGDLGDLGVELVKLLLWFARKYGRIFPKYATLAAILRKTEKTIIEAVKLLIEAGFVKKHRRSKKIETPQGARRVQDSNAYEVCLPDATSSSSAPLFAGSDCKNFKVSSPTPQNSKQSELASADEGRFWLADVHQMGNGSCY
jgi:hypothetical protein